MGILIATDRAARSRDSPDGIKNDDYNA